VGQAGAAPHIELRGAFGDRTIDTEVITVRDLGGAPLELPDEPEPPEADLGSIGGGREITGWVGTGAGAAGPMLDVSITAELAIAGERAVPLDLGLSGTSLSFALPDVDAQARLDITVAFRDACYGYEASGSAAFLLGSSATVASCAFDPAVGLAPYLDDLLDQPILVGAVEVMPAFSGADARWAVGNAATDYGTLFPGWDREAEAVSGAPGASIVVSAAASDLELTGMRTQFYELGDALREHEIELEPIWTTDPPVRADGSFALRLPANPGRYVTATAVSWLAACASGVSIANFEVDVQ
jgi:hypothetical protein